MKFSFKRTLAFLLTIAMIVPMLPVMSTHVHAAQSLTVGVNGLSVSADNNGDYNTWSASGSTITGTATGYKSLVVISKSTSTTVTLTNNLGEEAKLKLSYTVAGGGSVSSDPKGITGGSHEVVLQNDKSLKITLKSPSGSGTATLNITGISLISTSAADVTTTFNPAEGGSYTVNGAAITASTSQTAAAGTEYKLAATPSSDCQFFGWSNGSSYVSYDATYTLIPSQNQTITPVFVAKTDAVFEVGGVRFNNLTQACNAAASGSNKTVVLVKDGTVSGNHTIPAGVTLLIPFDTLNTTYGSDPDSTSYTDLLGGRGCVAWVKPTAYKTLTFAADAEITVNGAIEVGGQHAASNGGNMYCGAPTGPVGFINMASGSNITLNSGSNLYCWGYITGGGNVIANSGSKVYENFQFTDFRGGDDTSKLAQNYAEKYGVFPINQYYVQNIEVPLTLIAGATEYSATSIYSSRMEATSTIAFIGNTKDSMFKLVSGSVTKSYNGSSDRMSIEINGELSVSPISMGIGGINLSSEQFALPVTNNMSIVVKSGSKISISQDIALLPGAEIVVEYGAECILDEDVNAYIYDADNWGTYCGAAPNGVKKLIPIAYAPGRGANVNRATQTLLDAKIVVNGEMDASKGFVYTTGGGAQIINGGTGIVYMNPEQPKTSKTYQNIYNSSDAEAGMQEIAVNSVWLKNGGIEGSTYTKTGEIESVNNTYEYCADCNRWYTGQHKFEVTWMGATGVITTEEYCVDAVPSYKGEDPTKGYNADDCHCYDFIGWAADENDTVVEIAPVSGDVTYWAVFELKEEHQLDTFIYVTNNDGTHQKKLTCCGQMIAAAESCSDGDDKNHLCDYCEYTTPLSSCSDKDGDGDHTCDHCGLVDDVTSHVPDREAPTCTEAQICTECSTTLQEKTGHGTEYIYTNNGDTHSATYKCCGATYVTGEPHTYENGKCVCGADEPAPAGLKGDLDFNGVVDAADLLIFARHVGGVEEFTDPLKLANADINSDGVEDAADLLILARYVGGVDTDWDY